MSTPQAELAEEVRVGQPNNPEAYLRIRVDQEGYPITYVDDSLAILNASGYDTQPKVRYSESETEIEVEE